MVTALKPETETSPAVAETATTPNVVVAPAPAAPAADVSAVPETPAELLKQWDTPARRRPLIHIVVSATLVRLWDAIAGPPMTERQRVNRDIAEYRGLSQTLRRNG